MPIHDVSDVTLDVDFVDKLAYERSAKTVSGGGVAGITMKLLTLFGVVTSLDGSLLNRIPEGERISGSIFVHTRQRLTAGDGVNTADVIQYLGRRWTVAQVNDYSRYGLGFVCAKCDLIPLSGGPDI